MLDDGNLGSMEKVRKLQLKDLEARKAAQEPQDDDTSTPADSTPKRKRAANCSSSRPSSAPKKRKLSTPKP
jgi:hypothetical protein